MQIRFSTSSQSGAVVAFAFEGADGPVWTVPALDLDARAAGALARAAADQRFKGGAGKVLDLQSPAAGLARVICVGLGKPEALEQLGVATAAARGVKALAGAGVGTADLLLVGAAGLDTAAFAAEAAFGARLAGYRFDRYKTRRKPDDAPKLDAIVVVTGDVAGAEAAHAGRSAVADGVVFARDLVLEPSNVLYPEEFARRARGLEALGVVVEVLGEKEMTALGMGALLGVGQGSRRESQLVAMRWSGGPADQAPLAIVGKGVTFDTGGISIKPAGGMEEMKGDMGGAAAVVGAMHAIAARKAKANVIGVIGLVENMPDGNAQRPGDIVTTMSGQTVEVLNTDAEGRLVLCDAMTWVQRTHKPSALIDLATLTGAIIISLGHDYAGLFSNNDGLAGKIDAAGTASGEPVWRLPQGKSYDKLLDSPVADIKNVQRSGPGSPAGSITAAQFLGRFVEDDRPWAHIDIAGTAWKQGADDPLTPAWATGYGVRLLDRLVADAFEG